MLDSGDVAVSGLRVSDQAGRGVDLPSPLVLILEEAARLIADGVAVSVVGRESEFTSQQVADVLNVSRQFAVRLMERGELPSFKAGSHRRVRAADLEAFQRRRAAGRRATLDALAADAQASGAYDGAVVLGPRRQA